MPVYSKFDFWLQLLQSGKRLSVLSYLLVIGAVHCNLINMLTNAYWMWGNEKVIFHIFIYILQLEQL